jgi:predicted dehydrogenase
VRKKLKVGLIGTGRLGWLYAELLRTQIPDAQLFAVAGHRAEEIAREWGIPVWSLDRSSVITNEDVDAIVIVTNTGTHIEFIDEAVMAGKPVFCEKPLALDSVGLGVMALRLDQFQNYVQIGFMRRYDPAIAQMHFELTTGNIGNPVLFKSTSRDKALPTFEYCKTSGGLLLDMGIHDFDLARFFFGEVVSVTALGRVNVYDELLDINDIDNAVVTLEFENGTLGVIDVSRCAHYGYDVHTEILGSHGALRGGYYPQTAVMRFAENSISHDVVPGFHERYREAFRLQLLDFVSRVQKGEESPITFRDGLEALRLAEAANQSLRTGSKVRL